MSADQRRCVRRAAPTGSPIPGPTGTSSALGPCGIGAFARGPERHDLTGEAGARVPHQAKPVRSGTLEDDVTRVVPLADSWRQIDD